MPDCTGRGCGLDPVCYVSCGDCDPLAGEVCDTSGVCVCVPSCLGRARTSLGSWRALPQAEQEQVITFAVQQQRIEQRLYSALLMARGNEEVEVVGILRAVSHEAQATQRQAAETQAGQAKRRNRDWRSPIVIHRE